MIDASIAEKRRQAETAREHLLATAHELQARLKPAALADQAVEKIRLKSERATEDVVAAARRRPVVVAAAATGIVALVAARPIARLVGWIRNRD